MVGLTLFLHSKHAELILFLRDFALIALRFPVGRSIRLAAEEMSVASSSTSVSPTASSMALASDSEAASGLALSGLLILGDKDSEAVEASLVLILGRVAERLVCSSMAFRILRLRPPRGYPYMHS